jgi:hypothetical protein
MRGYWLAVRWVPLSGSAELTGVSCTTNSFCMAVGTKQHGSGLLAETFNGAKWRHVAPRGDGTRSRLASVSCRSGHWCVAVGYTSERPSGELPLAEFWNGRSWHPDVIHTETGLSSVQWSLLEGVSCPTETRCYAVGQSGPAQPDQELDLFATWTAGQGWTYTTLNATQTIVLNLSGVSCSSLNACFAVGQSNWKGGSPASEQDLYYAYQQVNGTYQWAGTTTAGTYSGVALNAVACPGDYQCVAVGQGTAGAAPTSSLASVSFGLTNGTSNPVSAPAGATAASLNGIACPTTSNCTSVGYAQMGKRLSPLSESWNGSSWTIEPLA